VLFLVVAQSTGQRARCRRRQCDCGSPESEHDCAEHQVRTRNTFFKNFHIPEAYPAWILFLIIFLSGFWLLCSLEFNDLGPEGGKAIAEALKVNESVQNIK
jgi:hypothetical protein